MDQFFDDGVRPMAYTIGRNLSSAPALNVKEHKDRYEITLAVPGIDANKAKVELKENILTISYEDKMEDVQKEGDMVRQEYSEYVSFTRSLSLPKNVDENSIKAKYGKGILAIHINKLPEAQPRSVNIEVTE
jgi:HSP20 family protein